MRLPSLRMPVILRRSPGSSHFCPTGFKFSDSYDPVRFSHSLEQHRTQESTDLITGFYKDYISRSAKWRHTKDEVRERPYSFHTLTPWTQRMHPLGIALCSPIRKLPWALASTVFIGLSFYIWLIKFLVKWLNSVSSPLPFLVSWVFNSGQAGPKFEHSNPMVSLTGDQLPSWNYTGGYGQPLHLHNKETSIT